MAKYRVYLTGAVFAYIDIDANNATDANEKAEEEAKNGSSSVQIEKYPKDDWEVSTECTLLLDEGNTEGDNNG